MIRTTGNPVSQRAFYVSTSRRLYMTLPLKLLTALPLVALMAGCVASGDNRVDSVEDIEQVIDDDIDGDGSVPSPTGAEITVDS
jgi:hypothetical protein